MPLIWLNGSFLDETAASVPVNDAGLLYGAGVFTTMQSLRGIVFRLDQHLARVRRSCEILGIGLQYSDDQLRAAATTLLSRNTLNDGRLRLTVTAYAGVLQPASSSQATGSGTVLLSAVPLEPRAAQDYAHGVAITGRENLTANPFDIQSGHKTLNYYSRLRALHAARTQNMAERSGSIPTGTFSPDRCRTCSRLSAASFSRRRRSRIFQRLRRTPTRPVARAQFCPASRGLWCWSSHTVQP